MLLRPTFWVRAVREGVTGLALMFVRHLPGAVGIRLRYLYYRRRLGALGEGTQIDEGVHITGGEHVFIGKHCWIAANSFLGAGPPSMENRALVTRDNDDYRGRQGELHIGDYVYVAPHALINAHGGVAIEATVSISAGAKLFSFTHHYRDREGAPGVPTYVSGRRRRPGDEAVITGPVVVREGCQVGANAIVLPGVTIGPRTWLGAGGVAAKRLEPDRVYRSPGLSPR